MTQENKPAAAIYGAGLAGCEAAATLLRAGCDVRLCDMKPQEKSPAHNLPDLAELVCSNSLGSELL
jgi:methylenetetrahydrofolate--tRNA-(uracil-5-)-methyltransferase